MSRARIFRFYFRSHVTPYVILFIERDGSTYLTSLLTSHPEVRAVYERFAVMRQKGERAQAQLQWARDFLSPPIVGASAAIGFKTKLVDVLDPEGFAEVLRATRSRVLQMQRRNHVKAVVSRINARRLHASSGNWNLYHEEDRLPPLAIDVEEFERDLQERAQAERELESYVARLRLPALRLVYEDLLGDREGTLQKVFSFLGLRPMRLQEKTLKHTSDDLRQAVLNFDDLRARYAGTAYEPMFDERLQSAI